MNQIPEFTVIGGGIIGMLTAKQLVDHGHSVMLIDKSNAGTESSWAGGGILLPLYPWRQAKAISTLVKESLSIYPILSKQLTTTTTIDPEWHDCGMLITNNPDIEKATSWCEQYHIPYQFADHHHLSRFNTTTENPLWLPSIAQARNPRLLKSLKAYLQKKQVILKESFPINGCKVENHSIKSIYSDHQSFPVEQVVICAGAWTGELTKSLLPQNTKLPEITPVKGQMLLFDANTNVLSHMILDKNHYLIPRKDGKILAGSTVEYNGFNKQTDKKTYQALFEFATQLCPELANYPVIKHWAGIRPGTQEGIPYISKHPTIENLSINAGHFRNGLVMGPSSAKLLADLTLNRPLSVDPIPYQL